MNVTLLTVLLALGWAAATGNFSAMNLVFGGLVAGFCLFLIRGRIGGRRFWGKLGRVLSLAWLFVRELWLSAVRVALLVARPRLDISPAMITFPLTAKSDIEITLLANLVTLTPGTLSVDVSDDRKTLLIHAIDVRDPEALIAEIRDGFEAKVMEACR